MTSVTPLDHPLLAATSLVHDDFRNQPLVLGDQREWAEYRWRLNNLFNA